MGILNDTRFVHAAFLTQIHIQHGVSYLSGLMSATGASMQRARDHLAPSTMNAAAALGGELSDFELMSALAERSAPQSNGVIFLRHIFGRQRPTWEAEVWGTMVGLSSESTTGDMVRAAMEGTAYEVAANLPIAAQLGLPVAEIRAGGGPNKSAVWNQICADVCGVPLITTVTDGDAAVGCAWMSAAADGAVDLATCAEDYAEIKRVYEPNARNHEHYNEIGVALDRLDPALQEYYSVIAGHDRRG